MRGSAPRPGRGNDSPTSRGKPAASLFPPPGFAGSAGQGERDDYASEEGRTEEGRACVSSRTRSWSRPLSFFAGQRVKGRITGAVSGEKAVRKAVEKHLPDLLSPLPFFGAPTPGRCQESGRGEDSGRCQESGRRRRCRRCGRKIRSRVKKMLDAVPENE